MNYIGILLYITTVVAFLQGYLLAAFIALTLYSLRHGAGLVIPMAILLDGYFGNFYQLPYLSLLAVWWYLVIEYTRPRLANIGMMSLKSWQS
jgi:hypothetical protein